MSLFSELKRRNVFRVAAAYLIVAWLLTEILATVLPMFGVPDWVGVAVVIVVALTFIPVLIFAWAFEITPEGIKREKDVNRDSSITSQTGKKLDYVTIAAVVIGVGFLAFSKDGTQAPEAPIEVTETSGAPSVAVLPFVNMSGNAENEYFSDGLTETLLHMLAQVPDIKVAARTSSFAFKGKEQDIRKIALALGVAHVLEGSVQRSGDKVRVTAQLIRADDGFHVWSSIYDRQLNDIFAIQDEIAADVGESLTASLLGEDPVTIESVGTENILAYDLYLQALSHRASGSYDSLRMAEEVLKQALLLDSSFHDAKKMLAVIYMNQQITGLRDLEEAMANSLELLQQVLAANPDDRVAQAYQISIGAFQSENAGAFMAVIDAIPELQKIVSSSPNDVDLKMLLSRLLVATGRDAEALDVVEQAIQIDPVSPELHYQLGYAHFQLENLEEARASFERSLEIRPDQPNVHGRLAEIDAALGNAAAALGHTLDAMALDPKDHEIAAGLAMVFYRLGFADMGDQYRDRALLIAPNGSATRMSALFGARMKGDFELSERLGRSMIIDDVDERHGSYFAAVYEVLQNGVARENAQAALDFVEQHQPDFNDPGSSSLPMKARWAQSGAFNAWYAAYGPEKTRSLADEYWQVLEAMGENQGDWEITYLEVLALRGDVDVAVDYAVNATLAIPITEAMWWIEVFDNPYMADVSADPRVQAGLQQWQEDLIQARSDVGEFMASRK